MPFLPVILLLLSWPPSHPILLVHPSLQDKENSIILDSVPYGTDGSFAINLWMRRQPDSEFNGKVFQYLYSHTSGDAASPMSPNQVCQPPGHLVAGRRDPVC